jgi:hypothetical protein
MDEKSPRLVATSQNWGKIYITLTLMQQKYEKIGQKISNMGIFYFERQNTSKDFSFSFSQKNSL